MESRRQRYASAIQIAVFLLLIMFVVLFPAYWMALTSIKPNREMYRVDALLVVEQPTFEHYGELIAETSFVAQFRNSVIVAVSTTILAVATSTLAAYSLTRVRYPGRNLASAAVFFAYLLPPSLLFIPMYLVFVRLDLLNTPLVLVLSYMTITVPFCTWMLKGYFHNIPRELEDAAFVDGSTRLQALRDVVIPVAAPGIVASAMFAFTLAWNEYLYAFIFTSSADRATLPVGLAALILGDVFQYGQIMAGAVMMSLPILALYVVGQRYIISGMTAGAIKG